MFLCIRILKGFFMKITTILLMHLFLMNTAWCTDYDDPEFSDCLNLLIVDDAGSFLNEEFVNNNFEQRGELSSATQRNTSAVSLESEFSLKSISSSDTSDIKDESHNQKKKRKKDATQKTTKSQSTQEKRVKQRTRDLEEKNRIEKEKEDIISAEYSASNIVERLFFMPADVSAFERDLLIKKRSSELSFGQNNIYAVIFSDIPVHLDYAYGLYYIRTGGSIGDFLELMNKNKVKLDVEYLDIKR
jgi:hypothetical protein